MRDYNHIRDRVEREIDEIMTEKKWTPKHAEALEELLLTLKCVEEMEQMGGGQEGHKKKKKMMKKMMNYNYYEDDEDDEEDEEEEMKKRRQRQHQKYERNSYENDNYERGNYERRMRGMGGRRPVPMDYHYLPWPHDDADYMEDWDYGYGPPMNMMPPFRYDRGRGQDQYNQYSYPRNQYEQGMGSSQSGTHNGSEQQSSGAQNTGTNTSQSAGVVRK